MGIDRINQVHKPNVRIFVVTHDPKLLDEIPDIPILQKTLLGELEIDQKYQGQNLAESRFLVSDDLLSGDYDFRGFVSARWDHRFPRWPKLSEIGTLFEGLTLPEHQRSFFAPISLRLTKSQVQSWLEIQDLLHPGMKGLMDQLIEFHSISFKRKVTYNLVMGNNFVIHSEVAEDFLAFWQESLVFLESAYGLDFPFKYRCHKCGVASEDGIDRWTRVRHAGFLLERVSALFFLSRPDLKSLYLHKGRIVELKRKLIYRGLGLGFRIASLGHKITSFGKPCKGGHQRIETEFKYE
jgi:hypothetical protein